jgi:hypothetical protein
MLLLNRPTTVALASILLASCGGGAFGDTGSSSTDDTSGEPTAPNLPEEEIIVDEPDDGTPNTGTPNECARESFEAERVPVSLHLVVDISGSMATLVGPTSTRWDAVRDAISEFIHSPESAGLNLALSYYPVQAPRELCVAHAECDASPCFTHVCAVELLLGLPQFCVPSRLNGQDRQACELALVDVDGDPQVVLATDLQPKDNVVASQLCLKSRFCSNLDTRFCLVDDDCPGGTCVEQLNQGICAGANSCDIADYSAPAVPVGLLPATAPALLASLAAVEPDVFARTPTHVALDGAYSHSMAWLKADPAVKTVVVLATDGFPDGCDLLSPQGDVVAGAPQMTLEALSRGRAEGMDTFVIGVVDDMQDPGGEGRMALGQMAQAGGTNDALIVTADDTTADGFLDALDRVRGAVLPCEYKIPKPDKGVANLNQLNVEVTRNGRTETAPKVLNAELCPSGELAWYYDGAEGSSAIVLCPATCTQLNAQPGARLDVVLGCATVVTIR